MAHPEVARARLDKIIEVMAEVAVVEQSYRMEGRTMAIILAPKAAPQKQGTAPRPQVTKSAPPPPVAASVDDVVDEDEEDEDEDDEDEENEEFDDELDGEEGDLDDNVEE
jgi:translation initiation factor IF-3